MADVPPEAVQQDNWFVLLDPAWQAANPDATPPPAAIVGGWMLDGEGKAGPFQPNPEYLPPDDTAPTDPTDAVLRLIARGETDLVDQLVPTLLDAVVEVACDDNDTPIIIDSPDGVPCVVVITAGSHKRRLPDARWWPTQATNLPDLTPPDCDIFLNPNSPSQFRLIANALRTTDAGDVADHGKLG